MEKATGGKMSTKLVRYKDVCAALIPMIADMLQKGDVEPAINTLTALGALEDVKTMVTPEDADLAKAVKEYCKAHSYDCESCEFHDCHNIDGCFWLEQEDTPEGWKL